MKREEKSLRQFAMVAKFLHDNKPIKSLESLFTLFQTSPDLIQFHLIWQILAKFSFGPYLSSSKFRKRKRQFLCCVHLLHNAGSWNKEISCRSGATKAEKCTKLHDSPAKLFVDINILFLCRSPCRRRRRWICCHPEIVLPSRGNVTSHFYSLLLVFLCLTRLAKKTANILP